MKIQSRIESNDGKRLPKDLQELEQAIAALPAEHRQPLADLFDRVAKSTHRRQRILGLVQEALSQLRLDMKYLLFDLEATRRERDQLRAGGDEGHDETS